METAVVLPSATGATTQLSSSIRPSCKKDQLASPRGHHQPLDAKEPAELVQQQRAVHPLPARREVGDAQPPQILQIGRGSLLGHRLDDVGGGAVLLFDGRGVVAQLPLGSRATMKLPSAFPSGLTKSASCGRLAFPRRPTSPAPGPLRRRSRRSWWWFHRGWPDSHRSRAARRRPCWPERSAARRRIPHRFFHPVR